MSGYVRYGVLFCNRSIIDVTGTDADVLLSDDGTSINLDKNYSMQLTVIAPPTPTPYSTPINHEPIPALNPLGMMLLVALLATTGFVVLRRRE